MMRRLRKTASALRRGDRVTVTFEAVVEGNGVLCPLGTGTSTYPRQTFGLAAGRVLATNLGRSATFDVVAPAAPVWRAGDVVVVRYEGNPTPYTYVRGSRNWPGERSPKTDAQMDALFAERAATPVLQAGGEPFDPARLP